MEESNKINDYIKKMDDANPLFKDLKDEEKIETAKFLVFRKELYAESDRGCALLAASYLDYQIEQALKKFLIGSKKHIDSLFNFNGPLGAFSSRIKMLYSLGGISKFAMNDLNLLRKIRNEFGHSPEIISFEDAKIKSQCLNFKMIGDFHKEAPRKRFITIVARLDGSIQAFRKSVEKMEEKPNPDVESQMSFVKDNVSKTIEQFKKGFEEEEGQI